MTTSNHRELLDHLEAISAIHQDMRFGQLLCNLATRIDLSPAAVWVVDDRVLSMEAGRHLESQLERLKRATPPLLRDDLRRDLIRRLGEWLDRHPGTSLGRTLEGLIASDFPDGTPADRAAALWDIEDAEMLPLIRGRLGQPAGTRA